MLDVGIWFGLVVLIFLCSFGCCLCRQLAKTQGHDRVRKQTVDKSLAMKQAGCSLLCSLITAYLLMCLILYIYMAAFKASLLYPGADEDDCCEFTPLPPGASETSFTTSEGDEISAWFIDATAAGYAGSVTYALYNHGSGKNMAADYRRERYDEYARLGLTLLVYDYPGYGTSTGSPSEASIMASAEAALAHLTSTAGVAEGEIVNVGRSLGGAVAIQLAAAHTFKGTLLQSTFASYAEAAAEGMPVGGWALSAAVGDTFDSVAHAEAASGGGPAG